ncbi:hypothetical protein BY996DRAFT_7326653, partial [Phakopsora pachyrhizi]
MSGDDACLKYRKNLISSPPKDLVNLRAYKTLLLRSVYMNLEGVFKTYKHNSGPQTILYHLLEARPAAYRLLQINENRADLKADTARIICDHLANIKHTEEDFFEFAGWMHFIAMIIDIGDVVKISPEAFAADIAFHVGLLSLEQKFNSDPDRSKIVKALLTILDERRQKFQRYKTFLKNFFKDYDEKLPWMREYYFPKNGLPENFYLRLSSKIEFDKKLYKLVDGINKSLKNKSPKYNAINKKIQKIRKIAQASSTSNVQSKIAAMASLFRYSVVHELKENVKNALKSIELNLNSDPQLRMLATVLISRLQPYF